MCVLKSKTAYEMRINGWSSYLCSSDLAGYCVEDVLLHVALDHLRHRHGIGQGIAEHAAEQTARFEDVGLRDRRVGLGQGVVVRRPQERQGSDQGSRADPRDARSEEHTSELQSLMRIPYAALCLKNKT